MLLDFAKICQQYIRLLFYCIFQLTNKILFIISKRFQFYLKRNMFYGVLCDASIAVLINFIYLFLIYRVSDASGTLELTEVKSGGGVTADDLQSSVSVLKFKDLRWAYSTLVQLSL